MLINNFAILGLSLLSIFFATFSHGTSYNLQSYSIGPGATNNSSSTTYSLQGSAGEQANGVTSGSTKTANNGSIQTEQLNIPPAPTLSNGSGTYYNQLNFIIATGGNPTDSTFAIAVSTNNFSTTLGYVQADGSINSTQVYQTYTAWGGGSGSFITGLTPSTTYEVKVAAMQGKFTNTNFGAYATASTVGVSTTFSVSPNSISIGNLLPGTVSTSGNLTFAFTTNANSGGSVYVSGVNVGLLSATQSHTIPAFTGNLAPQSEGFGIQATNASQTSGGPLTLVSPFNGSSNVVGADTTVPSQILTTTTAINGGAANANLQAIASTNTPASIDYLENLTFIAAASF